tara:strand:- start:946 stop:1884 length:939 start_codon:yes stop_codon:yes gene_type:complete
MIKTENNKIYIVMYHYVREIKKSKYPNLKGLEYNEFKRQIDYFEKNFNILSNDQISEILVSKKIPKKKSILLTFDDGYKDHYKYVYPYLIKKKISAIFYPSVMCVKNKKVLDVNKIHFLLEKEQDRDKLLNLIFFFTKKILNKDPDELKLDKIILKGRYDDNKTILIKRLLQNHLPLPERERIVNKVFNYVLDIDEKDFSSSLYMNSKDIIELYNNNFTIGSHGYNHFWWGKINKNLQEEEIKKSINFFKKIKVFDKNFSVCFPHGSYNTETNKLLEKYKIKFALTTKVGHVNKNNIRNKFRLPRFDTNDFK